MLLFLELGGVVSRYSKVGRLVIRLPCLLGHNSFLTGYEVDYGQGSFRLLDYLWYGCRVIRVAPVPGLDSAASTDSNGNKKVNSTKGLARSRLKPAGLLFSV